MLEFPVSSLTIPHYPIINLAVHDFLWYFPMGHVTYCCTFPEFPIITAFFFIIILKGKSKRGGCWIRDGKSHIFNMANIGLFPVSHVSNANAILECLRPALYFHFMNKFVIKAYNFWFVFNSEISNSYRGPVGTPSHNNLWQCLEISLESF